MKSFKFSSQLFLSNSFTISFKIIVSFEMQKPLDTSAQSHSRHAGYVNIDVYLRKYLTVSVLLIPNKKLLI